MVERLLGKKRGNCNIVGDITEEETIQRLIDHAIEDLGQLDIWVSNAGTSDHPGSLIWKVPPWRWDQQIALSLRYIL